MMTSSARVYAFCRPAIRSVGNLAALWICIGMLLVAPIDRAIAEADGQSIVSKYNARQIGAPGLQRIRLDIGTGSSTTRTFDLARVFSRRNSTTETIVVVTGTGPLVGTGLLIVEQSGLGIKDIYVHIPVGDRQIKRLEPSRYSARLLGSDFAYRDLGWTLPTEGRRYRVTPDTAGRVVGGTVLEVFESSSNGVSSGQYQQLVFSADATNLLARRSAGPKSLAAAPGRVFEVDHTECISGIATPTLISIREGNDWSRLTLLESRYFLGEVLPEELGPSRLLTIGESIKGILAGSRSQLIPEGSPCEKR